MVKARTIAVMVGVLADALAPAIAKLKAKKPDGKVEPDVVKAVEVAIRNAGNVTPEMLDAAIAGLERRLVRWVIGAALAAAVGAGSFGALLVWLAG